MSEMKTNSVTSGTTPQNSLSRAATTSTDSADTPAQTFTETFNDIIGKTRGTSKVNEEQLYGASVAQELLKRKGLDTYTEFNLAFKINMSESVPGRSGPSAEYSTNQALRELRKGGFISRDEVLSIRRKSFEAAQLDTNVRRLWDSSGGSENDGTVATQSFTKAVQLISERLGLEEATSTTSTKPTPVGTQDSDENTPTFAKTFTSLNGKTAASAKVNEEQLYGAVVSQRLLAEKGLDAQTEFNLAFKINMSEPVPGRSYSSAEYATNQALRELRKGGLLTRDEVLAIRMKAFDSAQLDNDFTKLWDSIGGKPNDKTVATETFSKAVELVSERLGNVVPEDPVEDPVDDPIIEIGKK
jgi:hypothetical protein